MKLAAYSVLIGISYYHLSTGAFILYDGSPLGATSVSPMQKYPQHVAGLIFVFVGLLVLMPILLERLKLKRRFISIALDILGLVPQQILLIVGAWASGGAIWNQQYADEVKRAFGFIYGDQCLIIIVSAIHLMSVIEFYIPKKSA